MPRSSAESLAGAAYRAGGKPPQPPKHLSVKARALWREITTSRPVDFFSPGATTLLAGFCEMAAAQEGNLRALAGSPADLELQKAAREMATILNSTAVKLRLAVSSSVRADAGILNEKSTAAPEGRDDDLLYGGPYNVIRF
jgi:hypothetical protein